MADKPLPYSVPIMGQSLTANENGEFSPRPLKLSDDGELGIARIKLTPVSGNVSDAGNNLLITPTPGKVLRVVYCGYNPSAAVECAFRFGASGQRWLDNNLVTGGAVVAKDLGDFRYLEGDVDEPLYLWLSAAVSVIWNVFYVER